MLGSKPLEKFIYAVYYAISITNQRGKRCRSEREEDGREASPDTAALRLTSPTMFPSLLSLHISTGGFDYVLAPLVRFLYRFSLPFLIFTSHL
ncbi:hypothetical protein F2Q69_00033099 [Brassica cretica]|uniref:Uncharacterized protein n=1 Tax=Brassica cretica TaxID=69181 RepID=A0A8S9SUC0_BRACR|nr:hypothetical protein F2Q69_00033099 [Brassica cretica]